MTYGTTTNAVQNDTFTNKEYYLTLKTYIVKTSHNQSSVKRQAIKHLFNSLISEEDSGGD